ncbi:hypothetical protein [Bradyrhizobium sp. JYMT SZCCT0428]|uniref:hypothetical protein n=1 Tax=Bradyrhizobium sp. JYMT SZCCT0428 TaxID=2807673 RepID=UPI001BAD604D|nr:hypothetical protein [Bradyrhizobium sp. JYMT SZCCT0428]MBR1154517.1 hypothetical protein [Bradyrhizobium sp. JYMT SZCCT0428]
MAISIFSAIVATASFLWNVWSKFIYPKPVVRVSFAMVTIMQQGAEDIEVLQLAATNMGPIEATLMKALIVFNRGPFKDKSYGILNVLPRAPQGPDLDYEWGLGGGPTACFPKTLAVGESFSVYLVPDHETLARGDYQVVGFDDSFGRSHWARRSDIIRTLPYIRDACERAGKNWRDRRRSRPWCD